jgi:phospholipase/lecithinase/hemolysin
LLLIRSLFLLLVCALSTAHANFASIYIFGDSVSATTTNNAPPSENTDYYGKRYCNGRSWVEVLAQRQGLGANSITNVNWSYSTNNVSFYGQYAPILVTNVLKFTAPNNASNCLFIIWVVNADLVGHCLDITVGADGGNFSNGTNLLVWQTNLNLDLTNYYRAITNLHSKGMRTLLAPNTVNIMLAPEFNQDNNTAYKSFVRDRIVSFNASYTTLLQQLQVQYPDLKIYVPDMFSLFDHVVTNPVPYGFTNALYNGQPIDALEYLANPATNTVATNYVFLDAVSPSARFHELFADVAQQSLSPVQFTGIAQTDTSNRLDAVNMPVGLNGLVLYATNAAQSMWLTNSTFNSTATAQSVFVYPTNSQRFYKFHFPYAWSWP